jgi:hypothetical protein
MLLGIKEKAYSINYSAERMFKLRQAVEAPQTRESPVESTPDK